MANQPKPQRDSDGCVRRLNLETGFAKLLLGALGVADVADGFLVIPALLPRLAQTARAGFARLDPALSQFRFHTQSRLFRHNFAVAPDVNRCAVGAGNLARHQGGAAKGAARAGEGIFWPLAVVSRFHLLTSNNCGLSSELSYTFHASASGL